MKYYQGFKKSDYNTIKNVIADSLIITEGNYKMKFSSESYYKHFKWDSVFKPVYKIVDLKEQGNHVGATVSVRSSRFKFLENNPLTCKRKFYFKRGKISKIENLDCLDANWENWQKQRDSLVQWIEINKPELHGFIHDLSEQGAIDYLNAIQSYKKRELE
ncbi:TRAPPC13 family protein [Gramella lutea]|uniref:TRAPPC13 family protein n=1 Tax=Christiangramia lutea TaxID=1607951 RepID=A0A9X1V6N4_9FLAO|nr:TRAPPC13 family protein [Christiangramia lutea]MCH4824646.1 TRAPPC13 family protein [Christiangramia lutea]